MEGFQFTGIEEILFNDLLQRNIQTEKEFRNKSQEFLKNYGIQYCPFHSQSLVENISPNDFILKIKGIKYKFNSSVCSKSFGCKTPISFSRDLITKILKTSDLKEVKSGKNNGCVTCGNYNKEDSVYLAGFVLKSSKGNSFKNNNFGQGIPLYFCKRECGHDYVFLQNSFIPELKLK